MRKRPKERPDPPGIPWLPDWSGYPVAVISAGFSATKEQAEEARALGCKVITVNRSFELAPWADIHYAADIVFWETHRKELSGLKGMKVVAAGKDEKGRKERLGLLTLPVEPPRNGEFRLSGDAVAHGHTSGFQAANLALITRGRPILLFAYDYGPTHWHGAHRRPLGEAKPNSVHKWREALERAVGLMKGHPFVNCSPVTKLKGMPQMTAREALRRAA